MPKQRTTAEERERKQDYRSRKRLAIDAGMTEPSSPTLPGMGSKARKIASAMQAAEKEISALQIADEHFPWHCSVLRSLAATLDNPMASTSHVAAAKQSLETLRELKELVTQLAATVKGQQDELVELEAIEDESYE